MIVADATTEGKESAVFPLSDGVPRVDNRRVSRGIVDVILTASNGTMLPTQRVATKPFRIVLGVGVAWACCNALSGRVSRHVPNAVI